MRCDVGVYGVLNLPEQVNSRSGPPPLADGFPGQSAFVRRRPHLRTTSLSGLLKERPPLNTRRLRGTPAFSEQQLPEQPPPLNTGPPPSLPPTPLFPSTSPPLSVLPFPSTSLPFRFPFPSPSPPYSLPVNTKWRLGKEVHPDSRYPCTTLQAHQTP